jgi:hypothetical protein
MKYYREIIAFIFVMFLLQSASAAAFPYLSIQSGVEKEDDSNLVYVDSFGRIRWTLNNEEAYFFGVNYSVPFAFSYRALKNKGISHKEAIDLDAQQFKRLELNAYRIHVWDREVSDREGNILNNEHMELLDYLINKLIENDIYIILTPIAWWGTGWPEPDYPTPGFSSFYSKIESTTKPEVIKAQVNYLKQFVNHVNPYTGKSYKEEKKIIAFEIFNEPNLPKDSDSVRNYVNTTVKAIREEGVTKPIFFNISENPGIEQWEGVASSNIDGMSFQWYPTGLVKYSELEGNFLPNVLSYTTPLFPPFTKGGSKGGFKGDIGGLAKMVYEFDAADIGESYMYPAMTHSFREAGMQWATMFCYDPTPIAQYNAEYQTHYLNLLYTPRKALSFLISSNLFKETKITSKITDSTSVLMNNVLSDYEKDLSLLNTSEKFYYSNTNSVLPADPISLKQVAGYGSSVLVEYGGRGSYFLDKVGENLWYLEVFPDAVWIKDPFGRNNLETAVAKLIWKKHTMKILLPDLKDGFNLLSVYGDKIVQAENLTVELQPGSYLVSNNEEISGKYSTQIDFKKIKAFGEFIDDFHSVEIKNITPRTFKENENKKIRAEVYSKDDDMEVFIHFKKPGWWGYRKSQMQKVDDFTYEISLPGDLSSNGIINYFISVKKGEEILTFPGKLKVLPEHWGFSQDNPSFELSIIPSSNKILIYNPLRDKKNLILPNIWRYIEYTADYTFDEESGEAELNLKITKAKEEFPELAFQIYAGNYLRDISLSKNSSVELELKASECIDSLSVRCIFNDGSGFEQKVAVKDKYEKILIPISEPAPVKYALLPRPYPVFLPYWFESTPPMNKNINNRRIKSIQFAIPLDNPPSSPLYQRGETGGLLFGIKLKKINYIE